MGQTFAGARACASCHPQEFQRHAASMHQRALRPATSSHASALFDRPIRERNGIEFTYAQTKDGLNVQAAKGESSSTAVLEWIFGAGLLAFTPVGRLNDGTYIEHRVSWYSASQRPGMTLGHPATTPASTTAALGQRQSAQTIFQCFNCHATGVTSGPDLSIMQPGVQCERCHGPAGDHVKLPTAKNITRLTKLSAKEGVAVCAECHRLPSVEDIQPEISDPMSIRFAPVGLMASKCFQDSGILTCITCHDPHGGPRPAAAVYEEKCRGCHTPASEVSSNCPRTTEPGCLQCHMQKAAPVPDLPFTDHRIRVYAIKN